MSTHTAAGEPRYTAAGDLTDAALAEMSIEDRNRYLDEIAASAEVELWLGHRGRFSGWLDLSLIV